MTKTTRDLVQELRSETCQCGKRKRCGNTFCSSCYFSLSNAQRKALYNQVGDGYEEAYADAMKVLTQ